MNIELVLIVLFVIGYALIAFEHPLKINKTAPALLLAVLSWAVYALSGVSTTEQVHGQLAHHMSDISEILFFLMGAMTIVELVALHNGFDHITQAIKTTNKRKLLCLIGFVTFFLSSILDNLTTAIVMVSLLRKLLNDRNDRMIFAAMVIIAANAGGAWSPIGDVTTTMLWIGGQVSSLHLMRELLLPSLVCLIVPLCYQSLFLKGDIEANLDTKQPPEPKSLPVLILGILSLLSVPLFKAVTHLPPYLGILGGMSILWIYTELVHGKDQNRDHLKINNALMRIDLSSVLFFLGILLAVASFEAVGILHHAATFLQNQIGNQTLIVTSLGILSAIIDNVPLTAAVQGMYDLSNFPTDHSLWVSLAYAVGTGGSILIIGSAAGVVVMGMENISFGWYLRHVSFTALLGYLAGIACYIITG